MGSPINIGRRALQMFPLLPPANRVVVKFLKTQPPTKAKAKINFTFEFSSLSAPTKIEELTAGSDEKTQRRPWVRFPAGLRSARVFFHLIRLSGLVSLSELKEKRISLGMIPTRASLRFIISLYSPE